MRRGIPIDRRVRTLSFPARRRYLECIPARCQSLGDECFLTCGAIGISVERLNTSRFYDRRAAKFDEPNQLPLEHVRDLDAWTHAWYDGAFRRDFNGLNNVMNLHLISRKRKPVFRDCWRAVLTGIVAISPLSAPLSTSLESN